jgi:hypothetical protein|tara:strand:+ start:5570 stop:5749 length:180 start_codon:yes stop_codon:yes gene_type:complete
MNQSELELEFKKIREEMERKDEKLRSKLSYLLSRIQELESSLECVKGDLFEKDDSKTNF